MCQLALDLTIVLASFVTLCAGVSAISLELPAFEYRRQFNLNLSPGQCPDRIVQYPQSRPIPEPCKFPWRTGEEEVHQKPLPHTQRTSIKTNADLLRLLPLCNQEAASYFGILAKGDCITSEIAQKLSFGRRTAVLVHLEHDRPRIRTLIPSATMDNIPDEFTNHLNNSYYTHKIDIGTDEVIISELWFKSDKDATLASKYFKDESLSQFFMGMMQNMHIALPRKVKMIRLSTAENVFETKVFKGSRSILDAISYAEASERNITRIKKQIFHGKDIPLKYTFTPYEIGPIPITIKKDTIVKRRLWEDVALLQVELKRIYTTNKRYRKFCRKTKNYRKFCLLAKQTLKELKGNITEVHTQRRDWSTLKFDAQPTYNDSLRGKLRILDDRMRMVAKHLRRAMRKKKTA